VSGADEVAAGHRRNLIAYLSRVQGLPPPTRDLIFLHSEAGVAANIEPATVDRLAEMARNGQTEGLEALLEELPAETKEEILATLARWSEEFALQTEKENAIRVLIAAAALVEAGAQTTALAAGAILASPGPLPGGALADTVRFTQRCGAIQRRALLGAFRDRDDLFEDAGTRAALVGAFEDFGDDEDLAAKALSVAIGENDQAAITVLIGLGAEGQARLLQGAGEGVKEWIDSELAPPAEGEEQAEGELGARQERVAALLGAGLDLAAASRPAASAFAAWLLYLDDAEADARVDAHLDGLAPVSAPDLAERFLARALYRPQAGRGRWLTALDPEAIESSMAERLDALAHQAWGELSDPESADPDEAYLQLLGNLAAGLGENAELPQAREAIVAALGAPMQDDEAAERRRTLAELATRFAAEGLVEHSDCADALVGACASAMEPLQPGDVAQLPGLRLIVSELLGDWLDEAGVEARRGLEAAATQVPDATLDPTKVNALLRSVCALGARGEEATTTITAAQVGALGRDYGDAAGGAVSAWLDCFTGDSELWPLVEPMWGTAISPELRGKLAAAAEAATEERRRALVKSAVDAALAGGSPSSENWEAVGLRYVKSGWLITLLAERIPASAEELEQWRRLLDVCRQRAPGSRSRSALASKLLKPLAQIGSDEAVNLMLEHLGMLGRKSAEELLAELRLSSEQKNRAEQRLKDLGFKKSAIRGVLDGIRGSSRDSE
jgi:hypothetical protein